MKPFFLMTTPRSRGTLLMRMLDATPGVTCAGEHTELLRHLRATVDLQAKLATAHAGETWPMHRQNVNAAWWRSDVAGLLMPFVDPAPFDTRYGIRSSFLGKDGWADAVDWWSWLLETWPNADIVFLGRDQGEVELSMLSSPHLWRPHYGSCAGNCGGKVLHHLRSMADFHEMNPDRTTMLDAADLSDFEKTAAALDRVGIPLDRAACEEQLAIVSGTRKESAPAKKAKKPSQRAALADLIFDPQTSYEKAAGLIEPPADAFEAWKLDPFGDAKLKGLVDAYEPKKPQGFMEQPALHQRAIVYPWLSTAAVWEELLRSLRSVDLNFTDKECPIYILGDAPPPGIDLRGRVKFLRMDYTRGRRRGLRQAFTTGLQLAEEVLWMNDDIYLLRPTGWEDMRVALTEGVLDDKAAEMLTSSNGWRRWLGESVLDLKKRGVGTVHRFTTHTPYLFEREKSLEILRTFHLPYKGGWVNRYHAWHRTPHRPCGHLKATALPCDPRARFLNHNDGTLTEALKAAISARFPDPAPWEIPEAVL